MKVKYYKETVEDVDIYVELCIIGSINLKKSSRQVTFSDIEVDFEGKTADDLPLKLQEIQIIDDERVVFYGYLDNYELPEFDKEDTYLKLNLTLLSPLALLSRKNITISGTYSLEEAINIIIAPLISEDFILGEINIPNKIINLNFISQTIEYVLNSLSNTENLFYYIDENKNITINTLERQFNKIPALEINNDNFKQIESIKSIKPSINSVDYCNVINAKNVMMYESSFSETYYGTPNTYGYLYPLFDLPKNLKQGDVVNFNYKIDISENTLRNIGNGKSGYTINALRIQFQYSSPSFGGVSYIEFNTTTNTYSTYNIKFDEDGDDTTATIALIRDDFFKNLIVGFKYLGNFDNSIDSIRSNSILLPSNVKFINSEEINLNKGKICKSGVIEKTIDMNNKWFAQKDIATYLRNLLSINSKETNQIIIKFKGQNLNNYKIGDIITFDLEDKFSVGKFAVVDSTLNIQNTILQELELTLRSANVFENYIDLFRLQEQQDNTEQINVEYLSEFAEEIINATNTIEEALT